MSLQWIIVSVVVVLCAIFSAWRLLSLRLRHALLERAARVLPAAVVSSTWFDRLRAGVQAQMIGGCGACAAKEPAGRARR